MTKIISIDSTAPDFALEDFNGRQVKLSEFRRKKNIILVFNRGFA